MNDSGWRTGTWTCRAAVLCCAALAARAGVSAQTIDSLSLAHGYGAGVHAYFGGDYDRSYEHLSAVIAAGSEDPRARYFRGLASLRLGRLDEAEADFTEGATLEAAALGSWPVSRSLERVQGHDRLRLERHRARARLVAVEQGRAAERARYSGISDAQPEILRRRRPVFETPPSDPANPFMDRPTEAAPATTDAEPLPTPEPADESAENPTIEMPADQGPFAPADAADPDMPAAPAGESPVTIEESPVEAPTPAGADEQTEPSEPAVDVPFGRNPAPVQEPAGDTGGIPAP